MDQVNTSWAPVHLVQAVQTAFQGGDVAGAEAVGERRDKLRPRRQARRRDDRRGAAADRPPQRPLRVADRLQQRDLRRTVVEMEL
jgi:hypothetical protein